MSILSLVMYKNSNFVLNCFANASMKNPSKVKYFSQIVDIFSTVLTTYAQNLWFLFPPALVLSLSSRHQKVIKWQLCVFKMLKFSLFHSNSFFLEPKKLSFDDFLMTTWEQENKRKKKPKHLPIECL